jgi:hypothetical protein
MADIEALSRQVDDATAAYILENQRCFEDLKQVASQLAGWLVLAAAGSKEALPDHPMLLAARELFRESDDALRRARPTGQAQRHHAYLLRAAKTIGLALRQAECAQDGALDSILAPLRNGYAALEGAADSLPGFEKISYERACCGLGHKSGPAQ